MSKINIVSNVPPPPSFIDVVNLIPKDFKPDYPPTDRLASIIDVWQLSVQMVKDLQIRLSDMGEDFQTTINIMRKVYLEMEDGPTKEVVRVWLSKFET